MKKEILIGLLLCFLTFLGQAKEHVVTTALDSSVLAVMNRYGLPATSLVVVADGALAYEKSYGMSDLHKGVKCRNGQLFRLASISKTITLIAILQLVQEGRLLLDDRVFGDNSVLGNDYGVVPSAALLSKITVRHLLEHKSGWQNVPNDPMFAYEGFSQQQLITELLKNRPLVTAPGDTYYYSNFGYLVLGRIIEKVSAMDYHSYVQKNILRKAGIRRMCIGGSTLEDRVKGEVRYYHQGTTWPYRFDLSRMDAHGGWVASARDLAKLIRLVDRNDRVKDLLAPQLMATTYLGYPVWNHTGSLPGTATVWMRLDDRLSFVLLSNARSDQPDFWKDFVDGVATEVRKTWKTAFK